MRFGLPLGYQDDVVLQKPEEFLLVHHEPSSTDQADRIASPTDLFKSTLRQFEQLQLQIQSTNVRKANSERQQQLSNYQLNSDALSQLVKGAFLSIVSRQGAEVERIIALQRQEEERKRKEREDAERQRKLREEEERKRKEEELRKAKELQEKKKKEEEVQRKKELEEKKRNEEKAAQEKEAEKQRKLQEEKEQADKKKGFTVASEVELTVQKYRTTILEIKTNIVQKVASDPQLKKDIGVVRRKINVKFGQLSNSKSQVFQICQEVVALVQPLQLNQLAYDWILNFISKAVVAQAEAEVTVKPSAALPLAHLALYLLDHLQGLDYFLCARFVKKCCFVVGYTGNINTEEGRVRMGWKRLDEKWEDEVKYEERVGGIFTVWAVLSNLNTAEDHLFFSMASQWRFLARFLNTDTALITNVHYVIASNWWEASAEKFSMHYKRQAQKMFQLLVGPWPAFGKQKSFPAATRLQLLGEDVAQGRWNSLKPMES